MKGPAAEGGFREFTVGGNDGGKRLDRVVRTILPGQGLSAVFGALRRGGIRVNGKRSKPDYRVVPGDRIEIAQALLPAESSSVPQKPSSVPQIPPVLHEDGDFLVLDKPRGLLVHGEGSLDEAVKLHLADRLPPSLAFSPGPLHRLDRNTTGVIFFSKSIAGARRFTEALREGRSSKLYLAIVEGELEKHDFWSDELVRDDTTKKTAVLRPRSEEAAAAGGGSKNPLAGGRSRAAFTEVWPLARAKGYSLVRIAISTGRTHQIRSQAAAHGYPLAGDAKYGGRPFPGGYHLHAAEFTLLEGEAPPFKPVLTVKAPLPEAFAEQAKRLFGDVYERLR